MAPRIQVCRLLVISIQILVVAAQQIYNNDYVSLKALKDVWVNTPPSWVGFDPCSDSWEGIRCTNSRVTSITLASMGLIGELTGDIVNLSELQILDLSYNTRLTGSLPPSIGNLRKLLNLNLVGCGLSGPIPDSIGSLDQLSTLYLNSNGFNGPIPPSIGNLKKLIVLDITDNKLSGTIPVSNGNMPGLDMLVQTWHFHFGKNQLSGPIPSRLFSSNMTLIHLLLDSNNLTGDIPPTLGLVQNLEVVRLDRNSLRGSVPSNMNNLTNVNDLRLSNNRLTGPLPNLTGMNFLHNLDMSNNTFEVSDVPLWFSTLQSLTTLMMEHTQLQGQVPVSLFSTPQLQTVVLRNNQLNGILDIGSSYSNQLQLVDLQNNSITAFTQSTGYYNGLILVGNPVCEKTGGIEQTYCILHQQNNSLYSMPQSNCIPTTCSSEQISSPTCVCSYPYTGTLYFRTNYSNQTSLMNYLKSFGLPVDSVSLSNPTKNLDDYLVLNLQVFPSGQDNFNRTGISEIGFVLCILGYLYFKPDNYDYFAGVHRKSSSTGIIIGAAVGGSGLVLLLLLAGFYTCRQKRRTERANKQNNPFALWDPKKSSGGVPQLKGARRFSFEELKKCTNNFSVANNIGSGGYGMVYRGNLPNGQLVAIKRAQQGSTQGGLEFKTEIELLSRVHHKNVVSLMGFCFDQGEQMLIYEYIPNGTLKESLSGKSGIRLDWTRRLRIALGVARGLQYLHDLANPPIIHRDIKSNNILLDKCLNAKVADFGLSKLMGDTEKGHVTTQVKGTMGYLDPEYYMTQQLTEKSDVYSFGVVMLELLTARAPIEKRKFIVREVKNAMDKTKDLYGLQGVLDQAIALGTEQRGLEKFVDLAMRCTEEAVAQRPAMSEVVKEIESIIELAGLNPNAESASTSESYQGTSKGSDHPCSNESLFSNSGAYIPSMLEPK